MSKKMIPEVRFEGFEGKWQSHSLGEILDYEQPTKYIVKSDKYINNHAIPVLTAGKSLLLGYTDETDGIYRANSKNAVIIFDDFTTSSHLIDYEFKVKSSALKILTIANSDYDIYFMHELMNNINYMPGNHERHWISIFAKLDVLVPSKEEQFKIGDFFKKIDCKIKLEEQNLHKLIQFKQAMLQKMFPKQGETEPEVRFEGFDDEWVVLKIKDLGEVITGNTPPTTDKSNYSKDGVLWVTPTDINKNITNQSARRLSKRGLAIARIVPKGSILVTSIASIGKNTLVNEIAGFNQQINAVIPNKGFDSYFLLTLSSMWSNQMKRTAASGTMQIVNRAQFLYIDTIVPDYEEQVAIGVFFKILDNKIKLEEQNLDKLNQFKKAMLQKMFV